jgi:hypothetical protein
MAFSVYRSVDSGSTTQFFALIGSGQPSMYLSLIVLGGGPPPAVTLTYGGVTCTPVYNQGAVTLSANGASVDIAYAAAPAAAPAPRVGLRYQISFTIDPGTTPAMIAGTIWTITIAGLAGQSFTWVVAGNQSDSYHDDSVPYVSTRGATIGGPLSVSGLSTLGTVTAQAMAVHSLSVSTSASLTGTLAVNGNTNIVGPLSVNGTLQVTNATVTGAAAVGGSLSVGAAMTSAALTVRKDVPGGTLGPVLTLTNGTGGGGSGSAIDFNGYDVGGNPATARIQSIDDGDYSSHLAFLTKNQGAAANGQIERMRVHSNGDVSISGNLSVGGSVRGGSPLIQMGTFSWDLHAGAFWTGTGDRTVAQAIQFAPAFPAGSNGVQVIVSLAQVDFSSAHNARLHAYAQNVTLAGFEIVLETWSDTMVYDAGVTWVAYAY